MSQAEPQSGGDDQLPADPVVEPLAPGEVRRFYSAPVMRTSIILSVLLGLFFFGLWFLLDPHIRAQFTWPQIATLLFFMVVMWSIMLGLGFSRVVATTEGLTVRNWLITKRLRWDQIETVLFNSGEAWPSLQLVPDDDHPQGDSVMVLGIQRAEGPRAFERFRELRALVKAQQNTSPGT